MFARCRTRIASAAPIVKAEHRPGRSEEERQAAEARRPRRSTRPTRSASRGRRRSRRPPPRAPRAARCASATPPVVATILPPRAKPEEERPPVADDAPPTPASTPMRSSPSQSPSSAAAAPLAMSSRSDARSRACQPNVRQTFDAPTLPLPTVRMSTPRTARGSQYPHGMLPRTYPAAMRRASLTGRSRRYGDAVPRDPAVDDVPVEVREERVDVGRAVGLVVEEVRVLVDVERDERRRVPDRERVLGVADVVEEPLLVPVVRRPGPAAAGHARSPSGRRARPRTEPKSRSISSRDRAVGVAAAAAEVLEVDLVVLDAADREGQVDLERPDVRVDLVRGREVDLAELRRGSRSASPRTPGRACSAPRPMRGRCPSISSSSGLSSPRRDLLVVVCQGRHASPICRLDSGASARARAYRSVTMRAALVTGGTGRVGRAIAARLEADGFAVLAAGRRDGDIARPPRRTRSSSGRQPSSAGSTSSCTRPPTASSRGPSRRCPRRTGTRPSARPPRGASSSRRPPPRTCARSSSASLVLIEDVAAYQPWPSFAPHCAAKAAQAMLTRVLARALAPTCASAASRPGPVAVEPEQEERRAAETRARPDRHPGGRRRGRRLSRLGAVRDGHVARRRRRPAPPLTARTQSESRLVFRIPVAYMSVAVATAESDSRLIERVAGGDRDAFTELYRRFARPVLGDGDAPARRQRPSRGGGAGDLRRRLALGAELPRRARLGVGLALRGRPPRDHRPRAPAARARWSRSRSRRPTRPAPTSAAEGAWLAWRVHSALEQLPERERAVLELAYWSGLSQSEIASYLDVPLGTVKTRTRTGLARLAGLLEEVRP